MSLKKSLLLGCCLCLIGLGIGGALYSFYNSQSRNPASALPAPMVKKGNWAAIQHDVAVVGKPQRTLDIAIVAVNGVPKSNEQELILRADVTLYQSLGNEIEYNWVLPAGATLVDGNLNDVWQNLKAGQTASSEISLLNVSSAEPKTIIFQAFGTRDGVKIGGSAAFSTKSNEKTLETLTATEKMETLEKKQRQAEALKNVQQ